MSASECQVRGGGAYEVTDCTISSLNCQRWNSVSLLGKAKVSSWAKFAVQISKDEAPTPLLTVGLLFIFMHLSCVHLAT